MRKSHLYRAILSSVVIVITACGPSEQDAQKLGFANVQQMEEIQKKGFKTNDDYAKSLGFTSVDEMKIYQEKGWKNKADYDNYMAAEQQKKCEEEAKANGFESCAKLTANNEWYYRLKNFISDVGYDQSVGEPTNRTRSQKEAYDSKSAALKKIGKEGIGVKLIDKTCYYAGRSSGNLSRLGCYNNYNPYIQTGVTSFDDIMYFIELSPEDSRAIGDVYKGDMFEFTAVVTSVEATYPPNGQSFTWVPVEIYAKGIKVKRY